MTNDGEEEEYRRRLFLFRALFDNDGEQNNGEVTRDVGSPQPTTSSFVHAKIGKGQRRKYTRVARIAQLDAWDCGVACLLMVAQWLRNDRGYDGGCFDTSRMALERKQILSVVGTESIWTSDLMRQLQSWKTKRKTTKWGSFASWLGAGIFDNTSSLEENTVAFVLASKQIMGADESYRDFQYYQNAFEEDQSRVASTFRDLHRQNVPMLQTTTKKNIGYGGRAEKGLSLLSVIEIVERDDCLAIVLLDINALFLGNTGQNDDLGLENDPSETNRPPYAGHYVILCGTSDHPKHVEIANSGDSEDTLCNREISFQEKATNATTSAKEFCFVLCNPDPSSTCAGSNYVFVTPQRLEASWRAEGTDEDIIFLRKIPKCNLKTTISMCE